MMKPLSEHEIKTLSFKSKHRKLSEVEAEALIENSELFLKNPLLSTSSILTELIAPPSDRRSPQSKTLRIYLNSKNQAELSIRSGYRDNPFKSVSRSEAIKVIESLYIRR